MKQSALKAEIILPFGFDLYLFSLKGSEIEELEYQCGKVGFGVIYQRVMTGQWLLSDLLHIIRLGLIGGGMDAIKAKELAERHCVAPFSGDENRPETIARKILAATMVGFEDLPENGASPMGEKQRPIDA